MATILPGSPPSFERNDVSGTVKALCSYTRGLQESLDFMLGQLQKSMTAVQNGIERLDTGVSGVQESMTELDSRYTELAARVTALEQKVN